MKLNAYRHLEILKIEKESTMHKFIGYGPRIFTILPQSPILLQS